MKWTPLERAEVTGPPSESVIRETLRANPFLSREGALEALEQDRAACEYWINDLYQVEVRRGERTAHLNIRRRDGKAIFRDWRHFQQIKNQIVGAECEAVELYPAESRLVDTSNKYHLWASTDPTFRFPFGFKARDTRHAELQDGPGVSQRLT